MSKRLKAEVRKQQILDAALHVAQRDGYFKMERSNIALKVGVVPSSITKYYTMTQLRRAVMRHAIKHEVLSIVAEGIVNKDKHALKAPDEIKQAALKSLLG